jgi:hypothetical protein
LAEICVKVVEYAEKHSWKQLLDPEKCYAEISKSVKIPPSNQEKDLSRQPTSPTTIIITAPPKKKSTDMVVKRRVYDVLHVLENTGVAKRKSYERTAGYSWLGLKSLASGLSEWKGISRQGGIKYEKALKHTKVPILSTITHMFLRVCYNKPGKTLTLKSAASEIYEELLDRIKREHSKKVPTQKGVERRLYDVVSVLSSVGIVVRSRKAIFRPKQILCKETCTKYAHQAMQHAKKNPQKRRKPRTSEEVALEKYLKALKKSSPMAGTPPPEMAPLPADASLVPPSLALKITAIKTPRGKKSSKAAGTTRKRKDTVARSAKKAKKSSKSQAKHSLFLSPSKVKSKKVKRAFGEAEKVGVHMDDLRLFVSAMGARVF